MSNFPYPQERSHHNNEPATTLTATLPSSSPVPSTMSEAVRVFFLSGDYGPSIIVLLLLGLSHWRLHMTASLLNGMDLAVFGAAMVVWWLQEYFLHDQVLHSQIDWIGKDIHQGHHDKPYHHVSLDPAALLVGWMAVAHVILFRWWLPLPLAVSATLGYSVAGLFYEWAHYIVHTKVRFKGWGSQFWIRVRDNHVRHHRICSDYWYAFSVPWMDDLFQSNPSVQDVQKKKTGQQRGAVKENTTNR
jgi:Fatty acid hydroxylase superfamily